MAKTVLITGANRGLGLGLVERYLQLENHIVIAAVRDPAAATSKALFDLPKHASSKVIVVKVDATIHSEAFSAVEELKSKHNITELDVVIANAGVSYVWPAIKDVKIEDIKGHMEPNVYGVISIFQATRPLLEASSKAGKEPAFVLMGSPAGLLANPPPVPNAAYGPSKAAAQWYIPRLHAEEPWLNSFSMNPGWVQTELGQTGAKGLGFESAPTTVEESCDRMMERMAETSRAAHGGKFVTFTGEVDDWRGNYSM